MLFTFAWAGLILPAVLPHTVAMTSPQEYTRSKVNNLPLSNNASNVLDKCKMSWILLKIILSIFLAIELADKHVCDAILP